MADEKLTSVEIDDLLYDLLGNVKGHVSDLGFVEPAILILHHCAASGSEAECDYHIRYHAHTISNVITTRTVPTLEYDTLRALPSIFERMEKTAPSAMPGGYAELREQIDYWTSFRLFMAGEAAPGRHLAEFERKLDAARNSPAHDRVNLVMASLNDSYPDLFSLGKTVRAEVSLRIHGEASLRGGSKPFVGFRGRVLEHDDPFATQLMRAVAFAEGYFSSGLGKPEITRLPREYTFGVSGEESSPDWARLFTGGSAGLGFALVSMTAIDGLHVRRNERLIRSDSAFTGGIDAEGAVLPVSNESIRHKVRSVFFSHNRRLVVPSVNRDAAGESLVELKGKYPGREIEIIPADTVEEVYGDERITEPKRVPASLVVGGRIGRRRRAVFAGVLAVFLAVMLSILLPPRLAGEMKEARFEGREIRFYNRYGFNYESYELPYHMKVKENNEYTDTSSKSHRIRIDDVDGDGISELVFIGVEAGEGATRPEGRIHVHLFSNDGKEVHHIETMDSIRFNWYGDMASYRNFCYCRDELTDIDDDGYKELILSINHSPMWFSAILNIDLETGHVQEFVHFGHMIRFITGDFDRDGSKEIIAGGECNAISPGVVVVLDPENMEGSSPAIDFVRFPDFERNVAKYYMLVPRTIVCDSTRSCDRPYVATLERFDDGRLKVGVWEGRDPDGGSANSLLYFIDQHWRCVGVTWTTPYVKRFRKVRDLEDTDDATAHNAIVDYLDRMKKEFRYYNGTGFEYEPVVNRGYIDAVSALGAEDGS